MSLHWSYILSRQPKLEKREKSRRDIQILIYGWIVKAVFSLSQPFWTYCHAFFSFFEHLRPKRTIISHVYSHKLSISSEQQTSMYLVESRIRIFLLVKSCIKCYLRQRDREKKKEEKKDEQNKKPIPIQMPCHIM